MAIDLLLKGSPLRPADVKRMKDAYAEALLIFPSAENCSYVADKLAVNVLAVCITGERNPKVIATRAVRQLAAVMPSSDQ